MAVSELRKGVVIMVMLMLVIAQADENHPSPQVVPPPIVPLGRFTCSAKCAIDCNPFKGSTVDFGACMYTCIKNCFHGSPSNVVYDCITGCALTKSIDSNNGINNLTFSVSFI